MYSSGRSRLHGSANRAARSSCEALKRVESLVHEHKDDKGLAAVAAALSLADTLGAEHQGVLLSSCSSCLCYLCTSFCALLTSQLSPVSLWQHCTLSLHQLSDESLYQPLWWFCCLLCGCSSFCTVSASCLYQQLPVSLPATVLALLSAVCLH